MGGGAIGFASCTGGGDRCDPSVWVAGGPITWQMGRCFRGSVNMGHGWELGTGVSYGCGCWGQCGLGVQRE